MAEEVDCDWVQIEHGHHPTKMSYIWYCEKLNAQIDSIKKPSRNRKVKPNSFTQNWKGGGRGHNFSQYFGAETFESPYNRRTDGTFDTPDRVMYQCDKCGHNHEGFEIHGMEVVCPNCGDSYRIGVDDKGAETFGAEGKVRTMSGKPHTPRKLVKDKNITPKEAAKRMKLEADEGTFYNDGRIAAGIVFMPEMKDRESFGLMDAEYAFTFGLSPDELINEMENGSSRYNQFSWGWGQEWDKLTSEYMLNPDEYSNESYQDDEFYNQSAEEFEGEMVGVAPFQEYFPDEKELMGWSGLVVLGCATLLGYEVYRNKFAKGAESFGASEECSEDADCPDGKVCVDGKCLTICVDDGDCPSWMECRDDLHPTEKVCGEDKSDSDENPFADLFNRRTDEGENPNDAPSNTKDTYSTTTKALFGVGIVGAIGIGIKVLGGMQDRER